MQNASTHDNDSKNEQMRMHAIKLSLGLFESELFHDVQMARLFPTPEQPDSKCFADASFKAGLEANLDNILGDYAKQKAQANFDSKGADLRDFVFKHFDLPVPEAVAADLDTSIEAQADRASRNAKPSMLAHIDKLWSQLKRSADQQEANSLIALPHAYIVPGGRFREIYYWDSFFTALGLVQSNRHELVKSMMQNFLFMQKTLGLIPNGNRSYYYSRSQPPVLALYVDLMQAHSEAFGFEQGSEFFEDCLAGLEKEYLFWMQGESSLSEQGCAVKRVIMMPNGSILNRYYDDDASPRAESYFEDKALAQNFVTQTEKERFYRNVRAACESGWDFSSRWFADGKNLESIETTQLAPVDLNCLLYFSELKLGQMYRSKEDEHSAAEYEGRAQARKAAIARYCFDQSQGFYTDYHFANNHYSKRLSLAGVLPLFVGIASESEAKSTVSVLEQHFLSSGGLLTSPSVTSEQWDAPNAWAPLQYFAVEGLSRYGFDALSQKVMNGWLSCVEAFYQEHGAMMEKYDVSGKGKHAGGGEYAVQQGFGWTNAVTQVFLSRS